MSNAALVTLALVAAPVAVLAPNPLSQEATGPGAPFPPATAIEQGISPDALARLDALVRSFVEDEEIVGGELLVIAGGRTIQHEAYG